MKKRKFKKTTKKFEMPNSVLFVSVFLLSIMLGIFTMKYLIDLYIN